MKKLISILLAALLLLAMSSMTLASTLGDGGSDAKDASMSVPETDDIVSVNVDWGEMKFAYTQQGWNPATLTYSDATAITPVNGSNYVKLTNYSNVPVTATCKLTNVASGVTGSVNGGGDTATESLSACTTGSDGGTCTFTVTFAPGDSFKPAADPSMQLATVTVSVVKAAQ